MKLLRNWAARGAHAWLQRFRQRYGLATTTPPVPVGQPAVPEGFQVLLHVGCGPATIEAIPVPGFRRGDPAWKEVRLDADARVAPDIVGTMTDMCAVPDGFADAVFSSHGIEHLFWHDVPKALAEFRRVLDDGGFAIVICPDLQTVAAMIADGRILETAYVADAGPITPFDVVFGHRASVEKVPEWMPHRCGFTLATLTEAVKAAGFESYFGLRRPEYLDLWVLASKSRRTSEEMELLAANYLPTTG